MKNSITTNQVFNFTSNGVIATDAEARIRLINQQAVDVLELDTKDVIGRNIIDLLPLLDNLVFKCLQTGNSQLGQHIIGNSVQLVVNVTAIKENGHIVGSVTNFQKLEQFEDSAQKLESYKQLNKYLEAIFEVSPDGIWIADEQGKIIALNKASEEIYGIKAADVIGKTGLELVKMGFIDRAVAPEVIQKRERISVLSYVKKTGKTVLMTGTPCFDENGKLISVVFNERDLTDLNAIREELEDNRKVTAKFKDELLELSMLELKENDIIAESAEMKKVIQIAIKLARREASRILILGESGTGKGLLAKFIHNCSRHHDKPIIQINCAALPENLLEAELFGYEKGAFTGAREQGKAGLFELAQKGTLFLDEIADIPMSVQAKLLKYLDDNEILPLGGIKPKRVECTIIAATNQDLESLVMKGKFRQDLFFRLNAFTLQIPPLRERSEDIFKLTAHFLEKYNNNYGLRRRISAAAMAKLQNYAFPGNARELKNILNNAVVLSETDTIDDALPSNTYKEKEKLVKYCWAPQEFQKSLKIKVQFAKIEKNILEEALKQYKSTRKAAKYLGISQSSVMRKIKKYELRAPGRT